MFRAAHSWGISPSEFWDMTFGEWLELADHYAGQQSVAGTSITESRLEEIQEWAAQVKAERGKNVASEG